MLDSIPFFKMSGCGNDFIIIDNIKLGIEKTHFPNLVKHICRRCTSVGGDGVIFIEESDVSDFRWFFFNSNGHEADMCGNGARCVARYAFINGIADRKMLFETNIGNITAEVKSNSVRVSMINPKDINISSCLELNDSVLALNTVNIGVPHAVIFVDDLDTLDVVNLGKSICHHEIFYPECINVNFVKVLDNFDIFIRTYERGVENETLACGTGSIATAIMCSIHYELSSPMSITSRNGNKLKVSFKKDNDTFRDVFLEGEARIIYTGTIWKEGWQYPPA